MAKQATTRRPTPCTPSASARSRGTAAERLPNPSASLRPRPCPPIPPWEEREWEVLEVSTSRRRRVTERRSRVANRRFGTIRFRDGMTDLEAGMEDRRVGMEDRRRATEDRREEATVVDHRVVDTEDRPVVDTEDLREVDTDRREAATATLAARVPLLSTSSSSSSGAARPLDNRNGTTREGRHVPRRLSRGGTTRDKDRGRVEVGGTRRGGIEARECKEKTRLAEHPSRPGREWKGSFGAEEDGFGAEDVGVGQEVGQRAEVLAIDQRDRRCRLSPVHREDPATGGEERRGGGRGVGGRTAFLNPRDLSC